MLYYSPIRTVNSNDSVNAMITFDAMQLNHTNVQLNWTSGIDAAVVHYVLERAINGAGYTTIANTPSLKHFSQQYFYTDMPANNINLPNATPIQYRLTAVLADSTKITVPIRTIDWINNNSLIKIYPNPTYTGDINLVYTADTGTVVAIQITDMQGRTAYTAQATATTWYNTTTFTTFHRAKGIYIVKIEIGDKSYVVKMEWE